MFVLTLLLTKREKKDERFSSPITRESLANRFLHPFDHLLRGPSHCSAIPKSENLEIRMLETSGCGCILLSKRVIQIRAWCFYQMHVLEFISSNEAFEALAQKDPWMCNSYVMYKYNTT